MRGTFLGNAPTSNSAALKVLNLSNGVANKTNLAAHCNKASSAHRKYSSSIPTATAAVCKMVISSPAIESQTTNAAKAHRKTVITSANPESQTTEASTSTSNTALTYTSYEGNAWGVYFTASGVNVLVDPWLVDSLTFGGLSQIYEGKKRVATPESIDIDALAAQTDFILLTMSIDDHAHKPTLARLPKSLVVVGSPSACAVARDLGYKTVIQVDHDETATVADGRITVTATAGALVGPPWSKRECGFVLAENVPEGNKLYYEPHCDYVASSVRKVGAVDVVVTPPSTQSLLGYDLVKGATDNVDLLRMLRPKVVIPLMNAEFDATGPLDALIKETGGPKDLEKAIKDDAELRKLDIKICLPSAGKPMPVAL